MIQISDLNKPLVRGNQTKIEIEQLDRKNSIGSFDEIGINDIHTKVKMMFTYSILSGILLAYQKMIYGIPIIQKRRKIAEKGTKKSKEFSEIYVHISDLIIEKKLPDFYKEISEKQFQIIDLKMSINSMSIFLDFWYDNREFLDLDKSLDIKKNYKNIKKAMGSDGGKGGEFFFFSVDNRVILKSMTGEEKWTLMKILGNFHFYLMNNPSSMIVKICGLYNFEAMNQSPLDSYVMLMRNIAMYPRKYIERTFDLKGSTYSREVLKKNKDKDPSKCTLKDVDFLKLEKKIFIENDKKEKLINALQNDVDFFEKHNIIDYSLLVFKINKKKYYETEPEENDNNLCCQTLQNNLFCLKSDKEEGIFYHIGIVDYLQLYNCNKFCEKVGKRIIEFDSKLDTSSQDSKTYATRFMKFMKRIIE